MRWTNREVRLLLKLLRRPHMLDREPLAVILREALHVDNARKAILMAVESAFDTATPSGHLLHEIIRRCDIEGETTTFAAASLNLSIRQFFRYRTDAIEAIAQSVARSLRQPDDSSRKQLVMASMVAEFDPRAALDMYLRAAPSPTGKTAFEIARAAIWTGVDPTQHIAACKGPWRLLALVTQARRFLAIGLRAESESLADQIRTALAGCSGPLYDEVAFELGELDRRAARRRGEMRRESEIVERLRKLARDDSRLVAFALLAEAEAACSAGELMTAAVAIAGAEHIAIQRRDIGVLARGAFASASLALLRGFHEDALALFNAAGAAIAAFDPSYALRSYAYGGRTALQLGIEWLPPKGLADIHTRSWVQAEIEAVRARAALAADPPLALSLAQSALQRAESSDAAVAQIYARATLAAALDVAGNSAGAKRLWLAAWSAANSVGDHSTLVDLFVVPGALVRDLGPLALDNDLVEAAQAYHEECFPAFPSSLTVEARRLKVELLKLSIAGAIGRPYEKDVASEVVRAAASELTALRFTAEQIAALSNSSSRATAIALSWLLAPVERAPFCASFLAHWDRFVVDIVDQMNALHPVAETRQEAPRKARSGKP